MRDIRQWLISVLGISRVEANGLVILLPVILFIILLPTLYKFTSHADPDGRSREHLDSLLSMIEVDTNAMVDLSKKELTLQYFNPNTVTARQLKQMNLTQKVIKNWVKYLDSGGTFKKVNDIQKIYGLSEDIFFKIRPFVKIPPEEPLGTMAKTTKGNNFHKATNNFIIERHEIQTFDINAADTATLKRLKGIGSVYAGRIVKYREILGGFINLDQLKEVYGLNNETLAVLDSMCYIRKGYKPRYIDINHFTEWELMKHPYITKKIAKTIYNYRYQHGDYSSVRDLYNIAVLDSLSISKVGPYLKFISE